MTPSPDKTKGPGRPGHRAVWFVRRIIGPVVRVCFRPTLTGNEHLPTDKPFLLVANHSAGVGLAELSSFAFLYLRDLGPDRPLAGFAHPVGFRFWPLKAIHRELGSVPSTYEAAYETLDQGVPLLVFPGGDHETLRPIWQANKVDFGGRRGFLRVAREANVPIVPMGIRGSHFTAPMLLRSKALAWILVVPRLLGVKRWGLSLLGVLGSLGLLALPFSWPLKALLVWLWLGSPLIFVPILPWRIRFRIGPPLEPEMIFQDEDDDLSEALEKVQGAIQRIVDGPFVE